jgi:hypothetical protein
MRYGFFAYEQRKTGINDVTFEYVAFTEVNHALGGHNSFRERLRPWALEVLRASKQEAGLFSFSYSEIDADDEPGDTLFWFHLVWDGQRELVPGQLTEYATSEVQ